ncbi:hypothetical protein DID88_008750 [Monilinia fructigena]|uniref:Carbonic anhydrase n=1 Tax=Monilinia fructigena TaxID=38457 RepID=A0A395J6B2_9HELO|nr:hypothetical protein DID88_008750 [Monilinia fructigena]
MTIATLLERNSATEKWPKHTQPIPTLAELGVMGKEPPHVVVLTCLDPRVVPERFLDIQLGDGVGVIRNAGGHVAPALKDIIALDAFLRFDEIMIIHHTDCGTTHFTNEGIRNSLKARIPTKHREIENMTFGAINDLKQSVIDDIAILRENPYIRQELAEKTSGFIYDLKKWKIGSRKILVN